MSNPPRPWDRIKVRQPGRNAESSQAYAAFKLYLDMGPGERSLAKVMSKRAAKEGTKSGRLEAWSSRYEWVARAAAYDEYIAGIELEEREKIAREKAALWAERMEKLREDEWTIAQKVLDRAKLMVEWPLTQVEVERDETDVKGADGRTVKHITNVTYIVPAKWTNRDIPAMVESASKVARLAAKMETERTTVQTELIVDEYSALIKKLREDGELSLPAPEEESQEGQWEYTEDIDPGEEG